MTSQKTRTSRTDSLLEDILQHVRAIDQNVEEVLYRLGDHLDEASYRDHWHGNNYGFTDNE